jgi:HAD superfamily phosphoserine phosphatase-like hydrolase
MVPSQKSILPSLLSKFAVGDWQTINGQFEDAKLTLAECLRQQFKLVPASREEILETLKNVVEFRPGFKELAEYCKSCHFSLTIVSAGLDFIIDHYLKLKGLDELASTYTAKAILTPNKIEFTFPDLFDRTSSNFKQDLVRQCKNQGKQVVYIGDGSGDYDAAEADCVFAIKDSSLATLCKKNRVNCTLIDDFREVVEKLEKAGRSSLMRALNTSEVKTNNFIRQEQKQGALSTSSREVIDLRLRVQRLSFST